MMYHTVLVGQDGFTKEDELILKEGSLPKRLFVSKATGNVGFYETDPLFKSVEILRRFYLITSFYGMGRNVAVYKELS